MPWQHRVEWPDEMVVLDTMFIIEHAEYQRLAGAYAVPGYILHGRAPGAWGFFAATKLGTGGTIVVTEDHDSGDEC